MRRTVKISEARKKLFDLMDEVTRTPGDVVVIEHRDKKERAVLIGEERLRLLELAAKSSRSRDDKFQLAGSIEFLIDPDDLEAAIEENRREQERLRAEEYEDYYNNG